MEYGICWLIFIKIWLAPVEPGCIKTEENGRPVHVITGEIAEKLGCTDFSSKRVITYQSIGKENGTMPIFMLDCLCCQCEKEEKWVEKPLVAVSERQKLSNVYDMILNPDDL